MDRAVLAASWSEAWNSGLWAASWSKSVERLTAAQAAWNPAPQRHSIWQIIEHIIFWRDVALARTAGSAGPSDDEVARRNFPPPADVSDAAWRGLTRRLTESQARVAVAIADPANSLDSLHYLIPHDCYHMGQLHYLRALQGLSPVE